MDGINIRVVLKSIGEIGENRFSCVPRIGETIHFWTSKDMKTLVVLDVNHFGAKTEDAGSPFVLLETEEYDEAKHSPKASYSEQAESGI